MNGQPSNHLYPPGTSPSGTQLNAAASEPKLPPPNPFDLPIVSGADPNKFVKKEFNGTDDTAYLDWASNLILDQNADFMASNYDFNTSAPAPPVASTTLSNPSQPPLNIDVNAQNSARGPVSLPTTISSAGLSSLDGLVPPKANGANVSSNTMQPAAHGNAIMQRIQYQNSVHVDTPQEFRTKQRRPCDHCRRRKIKCINIPGSNTCTQCETRDMQCTFNQPTFPSEQDSKRAKMAADSFSSHLDIVPPNVPIRNVAPVQDYSAMNNSLLKKTLSLQFPRSSFYIGPTSYLFDNNLLEVIINAHSKPSAGSTHNKIEQVNLSESISLRKVGPRTQFVLKDDQSKHSFQNMSNVVDSIEKFIAPHGQILIDLYFRIIHPSYPVLHKKVFLEKYSRTHREFNAPLLAAVYVLAIQWWDYDPQLNRYPKPNVELILKLALNNYTLEILKRPKLSAVQAGLLLLQCKHILHAAIDDKNAGSSSAQASASLNSSFNDSDYNDWVLCSQVVALSEELGLGLDCDNWKLPKWERGLRKRLAWAVYMEEKWLSLKNSRPLHIHEANFIVLPLAEEDFPEKHGDGDLKEGSSDIDNGKKNFMNLIGLTSILSEILDSFFSMRAMRDISDINDVLRIAKPIQLKLRLWYHSLPIELQMNSVQPRKLCSNGYLQLAYFATELTLHRKIITTIYQQTTKGSNIPEELVNVCRSAAKTRLLAAIEFVRDLKPEHIHSFWHCSATSNITLIGTFAALLFVSSTSNEEAEGYKEHIFNYRWILKISSKGFPQVGDALLKLDLILNHIPGLLNESAEQPSMVPNVPTIDYSKTVQKQLPLGQHPARLPSQQQIPPQQLPTQKQALKNENSPMQPYNTGQYASSNSQFMTNPGLNRSSSSVQNREKHIESIRPGSAQSYRMPSHSVHSPYGLPQAYQQTSTSAKNSQMGNSPHSSRGMSPEMLRLQKFGADEYPERPTPQRNPSQDSGKNEKPS